jgi:hypothetical protein
MRVRASQDIRFHEIRVDISRYTPIGMKLFPSALTKLSGLVGGGRVRFDHLEIAACMVAARHTETMIRHGHLQPWLQDHQTPTETLRAKLERYRRRARRQTEKQSGEDVYRDARHVWADVLCWIHTFYIWCDCTRPKGSRYLRWWYKSVVDRCVFLAAEGLIRRYRYPPPSRSAQTDFGACRSRQGISLLGSGGELKVDEPRQGKAVLLCCGSREPVARL